MKKVNQDKDFINQEAEQSENDSGFSFLRIGNDYYKIVYVPLVNDYIKSLTRINAGRIKDELTESERKRIITLDSFCNIPNNVNYQRIHKVDKDQWQLGAYNLYEPIDYKPVEGPFDTIKLFLTHIFAEQYELGLDYLSIIYRYPTQILPILCLVSNERNTGKTTYINFLKIVFGDNMTVNTNEDFRNNFNSGWASKLVVAVDEVLLDRMEDAERIKNLSTTKSIKSEAKGKDKVEIPFYGKFVLCSNNETGFIKISPNEIRFWIRKVPKFQKEIHDLLERMKPEIPGFLHFILNRPILHPKENRMWFKPDLLHTEALDKVKRGTTPRIEKEIREVINQVFQNKPELEEVFFTPTDISNEIRTNSGKIYAMTEIKEVLQHWGLPICKKKKYQRYSKVDEILDGEEKIITTWHTGTPYLIERKIFCTNADL
jgi:hypothetical protein